MENFHFLRPYWLIALICLFLLSWQVFKNADIKSAWADVCDKNLLRYLAVKGAKTQRKFLRYWTYIIVTLIVIALAGPTWIKKENPALSVDNPVMIMLNLSSNMWLKDVSPSRIVRAKFLIKDLTSTMQNTETGLLVYSAEPFMITPLTEDASLVENLLPALEANIMPKNGDRLDRAIDLAVERMKNSHFSEGNLVVLTADVGERFDAVLASAMKASESGFRVNVINIGAKDNEKLQMVADKGKGMYIPYKNGVQSLSAKINDITAKQIRQSQNMQVVWEDLGYYLFWLPALMMLYYFRRGILAVVFLTLLFSAQAKAGWFLNDNQEALQNFKAQKYEDAAQQFTDMRWKGAAEYRLGNYEEALNNFAQDKSTTALYNQGNALAKSGKLNEAIKKYEEVLKLDANFADAKFNLEYLKKQQQKNNQQNNQQQKNNKDKKQNQSQAKQDKNQQQQTDNKQSLQQQQNNKQQEEDKNKQNPQQQNQMQNSAGEQNGDDENQQKQPQQPNQNQQQSGENAESQQKSAKQPQQQENEQNNADKSKGYRQDLNDEQQQRSTFNQQEGDSKVPVSAKAGQKKMSPEEKEKMRARAQRYREIPEDRGGLLRALIKKEFDKNRYAN